MLASPLLRRFPSCPLPLRAGLQGLHPPGPGEQVNASRILSWALAPLQRLPKHRAAALSPWFPRNPTPGHNAERQLAAPPLRFRPLQRLPSPRQRHELAGNAFPTACAFRFSQPPGAFIRLEPAGLVPCRIRSWGPPFRAFFLPRSRTPFPAPLPSWRSNRLQGVAPRENPPPGPVV